MDLSSWLGHAKTTFHCSNKTIDIPLKNGSQTPLKDLVSSLTPPCRLTPLLPSGHLQTINTVITKTDVPIHYRRKIFDSNDPNYPGTFAVDFVSHTDGLAQGKSAGDADEGKRRPAQTRGNQYCPKRTRLFEEDEWAEVENGSHDTTPMLVVLHGLSGGSHEVYLKEVLAPLTIGSKEGEQRWEACVVTARGCAGSAITSGVLFNARATWDCRQMVKWLRKKFPNRPLFGVGFSLGANILVDYLGEEGERAELTAAVVCSNPWDLAAGNLSLQRSWMGKEVYSKTMGTNMKRLFMKHVEQAKQNPNVDVEAVMASKYLFEFDRALQCSTWGYPTEGAYYRDAASTEPLLNVRIPLLCINAEDDPVAPMEALPYEEVKRNPHAVLVATSMGGHLSWFEIGGTRWFVKPATGFFRKMAEEVDIGALQSRIGPNSEKPAFTTDSSDFDPLRRKLRLRS